jgi:hypothetical protein
MVSTLLIFGVEGHCVALPDGNTDDINWSSCDCMSSVGFRIPNEWFNSSKKVKSFQVKGLGPGKESGDCSIDVCSWVFGSVKGVGRVCCGDLWRVNSWGSKRLFSASAEVWIWSEGSSDGVLVVGKPFDG